MQNFKKLQSSDILQSSRSFINDSIATIFSQNSGPLEPVDNLELGMPFWHTANNTLYILTSLDPVTWEPLVATGEVSVDGIDTRADTSVTTLSRVAINNSTGVVVNTDAGQATFGKVNSTYGEISTSASKFVLTKNTEVNGAIGITGPLTTVEGLKVGATTVVNSSGNVNWDRIKNSNAVTGTNATRVEDVGSGNITSVQYYVEKVSANGIRMVKSNVRTNCNCNCDCDCNCNGI